jgi:hypothetical protein
MGCGEADASCEQVAVADAYYSSAEACTAATAAALEKYQDLAFPVIVAQCQPAGAKAAQQLKPADVALPEAEQPRQRSKPRRPIQTARL